MTILPQTCIFPPAVAAGEFHGNRYLAWIDMNNHLALMSTRDMVTFTNPVTLNEKSLQAPAITIFQNKLYLAWVEMDNKATCLLSSTDGINFSQKVTVNKGSTLAPALAVFEDRLYLAQTQGSGDAGGYITITSSTDGKTFTNPITICESASAPPALLNDGRVHLVLAWTERSTGLVNVAMLLPQGGMAKKQTLNEVSDSHYGPSLQPTQDGFTLGYITPGGQAISLVGISVSGENTFSIGERVETSTIFSWGAPSFMRLLQGNSQVSFVVWTNSYLNVAPLSDIIRSEATR